MDAAVKGANVSVATFFAAPSVINFGGGYLTGSQAAFSASYDAFRQAVLDVAATPIDLQRIGGEIMNALVEQVRQAGVLGAGGAGFPCHIKIDTKAEVLIANGAECEPLLYKDQLVMQRFTESMLAGMQLFMEQIGARGWVLAIKEKHHTSIGHVQPLLPSNIVLKIMPNVYPAGDEYELV